ncbi:MAG: hypothetical protein COA57_00100 [Flavobacteriales bacterium]|nr:MAG: hypothetical protein COA57_00100 [Flavobacteriales bacterium]
MNIIPLLAQNQEVFDFTQISGSTTGTLTINPGIAPLNHQLKSGKLYALLDLGEDYKLGNYSFEIEVTFTIDGNDGTNSYYNSGPRNLVITTNAPEQLFFFDFTEEPDITQFDISSINLVNADYSGNANPSDAADVKDHVENTTNGKANLRLTFYYETEYSIDVRDVNNQFLPVTITTLLGTKVTNRVQTFSWSNTYQFPNYQFELLRLYNTDDAFDDDREEIQTEIDWSKALKIETYSGAVDLTITIAEGTGFYAWRVRPIGTFYEGGIANAKNWGLYNSPALNDGDKHLNLASLGGSNNAYFYFEDPDENINWMYSRTFTEENKISEQINYAGRLLHTKQTQAHLQSNDHTIITQTVQDFSGRPALTTIPVPVAPVNGGGLEGYVPGMVTNSSGDLYTADDFDTDNNFDAPGVVGPSGPYDYYSDDNIAQPDLTIPDAEGYPYSRIVYFNDATGRVKEQSGVGKVHAIGLQSNGQGRTVRTFFGTPSDEELIRIFGDEAPSATTVFKTVTIDQNNTASITYTSKEGNVIATSLTVADGDALPAPDGANTAGADIISNITKNVPIEGGFYSTKRLAFSTVTDVNVTYKIECDVLDLACVTISGGCAYEAQFFIHNLITGTIHRSDVFPLDNYACDGGTNLRTISNITTWTPALPVNGGDVELQPGNYIFEKRIFSTADHENLVASSIDVVAKEQVQPLVNFLISLLKAVTNEGELNGFFNQVQVFTVALTDAHADFLISNDQNDYKDVRDFNNNLFDNFDFQLDYTIEFDQPFTGSNKPNFIIVKGGCCDAIQIPIRYTPQFNCPSVLDIFAAQPNQHPDIDFEQFMLDRISAQTGLAFSDLLPAYAPGEFNRMIFHMLTDEYKCDGAPAIQYQCKDLWKCWISVVSSFQDLLDQEDTYNVADGIDGDDQEDEQNPPETFDEHADDKDNADAGNWFIDWVTKRALSTRLRDDIPGGQGDVDFEVDLAEQFLNCTGYRFAKIIEPFGKPKDAEPLNDDISEYDNTNPPVFPPGHPTKAGELRYPYIKDPVFAFKYFEYNDMDSPNDPLLPRVKLLEITLCYKKFTFKRPLCEDPGCTDFKDKWGCDERFDFYSAIKSFRPLILIDEPPLEDSKCTDFDLNQMLSDLIGRCGSYCDDRRDEVRFAVENMFINNCYEIEGCPDNDNVVTLEDIELITTAIVQNCIDKCNNDFPSQPGFPICIQTECTRLLSDGTEQILSGYPFIELLPQCDLDAIFQIKHWRFNVNIKNVESKCPLPMRDNSVWWDNTTLCPTGSFSETYEVQVTSP